LGRKTLSMTQAFALAQSHLQSHLPPLRSEPLLRALVVHACAGALILAKVHLPL